MNFKGKEIKLLSCLKKHIFMIYNILLQPKYPQNCMGWETQILRKPFETDIGLETQMLSADQQSAVIASRCTARLKQNSWPVGCLVFQKFLCGKFQIKLQNKKVIISFERNSFWIEIISLKLCAFSTFVCDRFEQMLRVAASFIWKLSNISSTK